MTSEELERTINFIVEHQAKFTIDIERITANIDRFGAALQQEREERIRDKHGIHAMLVKLTELAELQSHRIDRFDEFHKLTRNDHKEMLERLDQILRLLASKN